MNREVKERVQLGCALALMVGAIVSATRCTPAQQQAAAQAAHAAPMVRDAVCSSLRLAPETSAVEHARKVCDDVTATERQVREAFQACFADP